MFKPRVRFAPSPTGELHIGGARTALFNYLFCRSAGGVFVLRIDDTDLERSREDYIEKLLLSMQWLGLKYDEGPYYQSKRIDLYKSEADRLIEAEKAYHCFCSIEELEAGRASARAEEKAYVYPGTCRELTQDEVKTRLQAGDKPVIRLLTPDHGKTTVNDLIRGEVVFENSMLDDIIIIKSNGLPTYNFASIIDDVQMEITHVIRAEEHLSNTPRQQLCAEALGNRLPVFAHVPMILAPDRSKLSKRHGATSVEEFHLDGYLPEALINYIALLGWSPGGEEEEILSMEELTEQFSLQKVTKTAAIYDVAKLTWMNGNYIRSYPLDRLTLAAQPFFEKAGFVEQPLTPDQEKYLQEVIETVRERAKTLPELADAATYFYRDVVSYDQKGAKKHFTKPGVADILRKAAERLNQLTDFSAVGAEAEYTALSEELELSKGRLIAPTRLAVTGRMDGPGLFELIAVIGKDITAARLLKAADYIDRELS